MKLPNVQLIDDYWTVLRKSYTMWLAYVMTGCGAVIAAIQAANSMSPDVIPKDWADFSTLWLMRVTFICTLALIPARIIQQPGVSKDQTG